MYIYVDFSSCTKIDVYEILYINLFSNLNINLKLNDYTSNKTKHFHIN